MSPSDKTVYLISGANRGIGYGLAALIAARPNTIVFAGARDPTAQSLKDLAAKHSNVHPVKLTSGDQADNEAAIAEIQKTAGRLDVLIANAGIAKYIGTLATTPLSEFRDHWEVNTLGIVVLFQAAHALLLASPTGAPIFAYISSGAASMTRYFDTQIAAYGSSKAAANFFVKVLDAEHPSLIAIAINPGWVATEMGNLSAVANGMPAAPVTVEDSAKGVISKIDSATKEKSSGRFWNFYAHMSGRPWDIETEEVPW
jgi:norsolorinic acid ketoreductase